MVGNLKNVSKYEKNSSKECRKTNGLRKCSMVKSFTWMMLHTGFQVKD
jgi:hypothetical protein